MRTVRDSRGRPAAIRRRGLVHAPGPFTAAQRRALLQRLATAAHTPEGRKLGELMAYRSDDGRGLFVATSSDRLAVYLGLFLEQGKRWDVAFGLTRGGHVLYVRAERRAVVHGAAERRGPRRQAA